MNNKEIRSLNNQFESNGRVVSGYAIRFNEESVFMGFTEVIRPNAITREQIENSDIFAFYNHNSEQVLARNGKANTLKLELREDGLWYEFEAPNTSIGDELLEHIKRNEMYGTSFAFSMNPDGTGENWSKRDDGTIFREITDIFMLYEVSPVFSPAYPTTSVSARSLEMVEKLKQNDNMNEETRNDEVKDENINDEETKNEETQDETVEQKGEDCENCDDEKRTEDETSDEETQEENTEDETKSEDDEENKQGTSENETEDENRQIKINKTRKTMEKRFSLLKSIRSVVNGENFDEATQAVIDKAAADMRAAGLEQQGQIVLPLGEKIEDRAVVTVTAEGQDVVVTDFTNILEPLHSKNVMSALGANIITGAVGDLQIPKMSAENVYWGTEISNAQDGAGTFSNVKLTPHRLTSYVDISRQMLLQDSLGVENMIRAELVNALTQRLEDTVFSANAATGGAPAGIFNGLTAKEVASYADLCEMESDVEDANVYGAMRYVLSPKSKATFRSMIKNTNNTGNVYENNEMDGTPAESTTHVATNMFAYGDWSNLVVVFWQNADILVDPYSVSLQGCVRLIISAYVDFKFIRPEALVYGTTDVE